MTVTGAYLDSDGKVYFHQMVLDRIERDEYVLQNTLVRHSPTEIRISQKNPYYAAYEKIVGNNQILNDYVYRRNGQILDLVNERINNMNPGRWYLCPTAYFITLTHL